MSRDIDVQRLAVAAGLLGLKFGQKRRDELGVRWVIVGAHDEWVNVKRADTPKKNWHPRGSYEVPLREVTEWTIL